MKNFRKIFKRTPKAWKMIRSVLDQNIHCPEIYLEEKDWKEVTEFIEESLGKYGELLVSIKVSSVVFPENTSTIFPINNALIRKSEN